ncbi:MAG TPA: glutathione peroxidase [Nevskia sp.]|nr:glutathione peroxidase [Nevskia sp.]
MAGQSSAVQNGRVPTVPLQVLQDGQPRMLDSAELFGGRTVIVFGLPGAFTPTCSSQHLPRYEELAPQLRRHGVDDIICIAVNDAYVMDAWARNQGVREVRMVADGNGDFTRAMGLLMDQSGKGLGGRSRRYSMLVRDGRIEHLLVEPDEPGDPYTVSDADTMLRHLAPHAKAPPRIAVLSKPGCPYCARAMRKLESRGLSYVEVPLDDSMRQRVLGAVAGASTAPQIFADGRRIGGESELDDYLRHQAAAPRQHGPAGEGPHETA